MNSWVFLRGLTRESRHWGAFPEMFRQEMPGARIHLPDLPGNGRLYAQQSPLAVDEMMERCRHRLLKEGLAFPCRLLALSLGGMVAVAWAVHHPEEIAGCVLVNTSLRPFSPFYERLQPRSYLPLLRLLLPGASAETKEWAILGLTTSCQVPNSNTVLADWIAYRRQYPVSFANALRQLSAALAYRAPARPPISPILLLAGARDGLVASQCSRTIARHWRVPLAEHPLAGHDLPLDDGPWVAREVRTWLQGDRCHKTVMSVG